MTNSRVFDPSEHRFFFSLANEIKREDKADANNRARNIDREIANFLGHTFHYTGQLCEHGETETGRPLTAALTNHLEREGALLALQKHERQYRVYLCATGGWPIADIARDEGLTETQVKRALDDARRTLRRYLRGLAPEREVA